MLMKIDGWTKNSNKQTNETKLSLLENLKSTGLDFIKHKLCTYCSSGPMLLHRLAKSQLQDNVISLFIGICTSRYRKMKGEADKCVMMTTVD